MIARSLVQRLSKGCLVNKITQTHKYKFASINPTFGSKEKLQLIKKQNWFQEYQTATKYSSQNNHVDALRHYYKVIQMMQQKDQKGQAYYYKIFQKILKLNVQLNRPLEAEQNLYKLIKVKKALQRNPILVYQDYQNLMIHQLNHNVQKSIKLGKALLSQSQINNLPINNQKNIRMLLGNAYLLMDNLPDAKKKYGQVLEMKPNHILKGKVLNNLSLACWWHKNPMFPSQQKNLQYDEARINRDFKQTKQLLMNSIGALQNIEEISEKQAISLQNLLNQVPQSMLTLSSKNISQQYSLQQKQVLQPIYNLIQYYIYNDPIQKQLIMAWMRILLKAASKFHSSHLIDEITAKYYLLNNQIPELKKLLMTLVDKYEKNIASNTSQELNPLILKFQLLQIYKMIGLIQKVSPFEASQVKFNPKKIQTIQKQLLQKDLYIFKRQFLISQEMSFIKNQENVL